MAKVYCPVCQLPFFVTPSRLDKVKSPCCSRRCMGIAVRAMPNVICECCKTPFHKKTSHIPKVKRHVCSRACRAALDRQNSQATFHERFWRNVDKRGPLHPYVPELGPCWIWTRARTSGYGVFQNNGKMRKSHILAYELIHGAFPKGMYGLHSCDNPICCNPYGHVYPGTPLDNMRDKKERHREKYLRGEECPHAKLTEKKVIEIYQHRGILSSYKTADKFSISPGHVQDIWRKKRWAHVLNSLP